ncbi:hypothetical protein AWF67_26320, partial [Escherichia coli]
MFTAIAPAIWGSTYIVTTQYLPNFSPMTVAMLRALPAGLLLVMIVRQIPTGIWWMRIFILGALNISLFWSLLFISVYRLPGGVAATVGAVQPLMVVFISAALLGSPIRLMAVLGAICGTAGVALLVLTPNAALDPVGVAAGLAGAVSMAFGTVLTRKWQPPVPLLTFTAWQLAAGGLLLVPVALVFDPPIPMPTGTNVLGLAWLGLIGAGLTYFLWFRGISRLEPTVVSLLGFLSPGTAVLLGWLFLDQTLSALQIIGVLLVIGSIWLGQRSNRTPRARIACRKSHKGERRPLRREALNPLASFRWARGMTVVAALMAVFFIMQLVGQVPAALWVIFGEDRFHWDATTIGISLAAFGILHSLAQAMITGPVAARLGERRALMLGMIADGTGYILLAFATRGWMAFPIMVLLASGGIGMPALQAMLSRQVDEERQGQLQGSLAALTSLTSIVGPLLFTAIYAASITTWNGWAWIAGA